MCVWMGLHHVFSRSCVVSFLRSYTSLAYFMLKKCAVCFFFCLSRGKNCLGITIITKMPRCILLSGFHLLCLAFWSDTWYMRDINILPRCKKVCLSSPGLNDDIMNNELSLVRYIKHKQHNERQSTFPCLLWGFFSLFLPLEFSSGKSYISKLLIVHISGFKATARTFFNPRKKKKN